MEELGESQLGTQDYWDRRYEEELKNFKDHGDPGEIWFGEDIVERIIIWMDEKGKLKKSTKLLDLGCGNGMLLIELARQGYTNLYGVDYSEPAIKLAKNVTEGQGFNINYSTCDILEGLQEIYEVIHDKGTYDAISLSSNAKENREKYLKNVYKSLEDDGIFIITSCNWTKCELDEQFKEFFKCFDVIPTPQFKFGGKVGNLVSSVIFKKIINK